MLFLNVLPQTPGMDLEPGAIHTWMLFEVMANDRDATEESLRDHVESLVELNHVTVKEKEYAPISEIDEPMPDVDTGYSQVCELELVVDNFAALMDIVVNYAPSSVEILGPEQLEMDLPTLQDGCYTVIELMQKFMRAGVGGAIMTGEPGEEGGTQIAG